MIALGLEERRSLEEDTKAVATWLRSVGRGKEAERQERCTERGASRLSVCQCGACNRLPGCECGSRNCLVGHDRYPARKRREVLELIGRQPWIWEVVATTPDKPWIWCPIHREATEVTCCDCPGVIRHSREDYGEADYGRWAEAISDAVVSLMPDGLLPAVFVWPHWIGESDLRKFAPHLNVIVTALGLRRTTGTVEKCLPKPWLEDCESDGCGGAGCCELGRWRERILSSLEIPWRHRGAGPKVRYHRSEADQAGKLRYVMRHPAEGKPGKCDPIERYRHSPPYSRWLRPGGAVPAHGAGKELRQAWIAARPSLGEAEVRELLADRCKECGEILRGEEILTDREGIVSIRTSLGSWYRRGPVGLERSIPLEAPASSWPWPEGPPADPSGPVPVSTPRNAKTARREVREADGGLWASIVREDRETRKQARAELRFREEWFLRGGRDPNDYEDSEDLLERIRRDRRYA